MRAVLLGQVGPGAGSANSNGAGVGFCQVMIALFSGVVDTVWLRAGLSPPTAANTHWALYAAAGGTVGARLTPDFSGKAAIASQPSPFPITGGLYVQQGTTYGLAFLGLATAFNYTDFATTGGTERDHTGLATLPTPYGTATSNVNIANCWAEGFILPPLVMQPQIRN